MRRTHTSTHVLLHGWAETDVLATDEHPGMKEMPRDGDECGLPDCDERLRAGERAFAVIEVDGSDKRGGWVGDTHEHHRIWRDGDPLE